MKKYKSIYVPMAMIFVSGILLFSIPTWTSQNQRAKKSKVEFFIFPVKALSTLCYSGLQKIFCRNKRRIKELDTK